MCDIYIECRDGKIPKHVSGDGMHGAFRYSKRIAKNNVRFCAVIENGDEGRKDWEDTRMPVPGSVKNNNQRFVPSMIFHVIQVGYPSVFLNDTLVCRTLVS